MSYIDSWAAVLEFYPEFPEAFHRAFRCIPELVLETTPDDNDDAGLLIVQLMLASMPDLDDIMLLCSKDRHFGALKLLRVLFERTVTLKYVAQNPSEARTFIAFDAIDWKAILTGIEKRSGLTASRETRDRIDAKAKEITRSRCQECSRPFGSWTPISTQDMAKKVGLERLNFEAFVLPSKFIHATYFGTQLVAKEGRTPLVNILKATHTLALETIFTHYRTFQHEPSEGVLAAVSGFIGVWNYAETDFGLGAEIERFGLTCRQEDDPV